MCVIVDRSHRVIREQPRPVQNTTIEADRRIVRQKVTVALQNRIAIIVNTLHQLNTNTNTVTEVNHLIVNRRDIHHVEVLLLDTGITNLTQDVADRQENTGKREAEHQMNTESISMKIERSEVDRLQENVINMRM